VNIVNFHIKDIEQNEAKKADKTESDGKYITYVQLMDRDTGELFYKKLTFIYLELPLFTKKENELKTGIEQWTFVLKHLPYLNDVPEALQNDVFVKLFQIAEIAKLPANDRKEYNRSLKSYRDMNNFIAQRDQKIAQRDLIIAQSKQEIARSKQEVARNKQEVADLKHEVKTYRKENEAKDKIIANLQRRLGLYDNNIN
jgi:hypothetical protein